MFDLKNKCINEWEKVIFWFVGFIFAIYIFNTLYELGTSTPPDRTNRSKAQDRGSVFNKNAFDFINDKQLEADRDNNPFKFKTVIKKERRRRTRTNNKGSKNTKNTNTAGNKNKNKNTNKTKNRPPRNPAEYRVLQYLGWMTGETGGSLAFVKVTDPKKKKAPATRYYLEVGKRVAGLKIKGFDDKLMKVEDSSGKIQSIRIHAQKKVRIK